MAKRKTCLIRRGNAAPQAEPVADVVGAVRVMGEAVHVLALTLTKVVRSMETLDALALVDRRLGDVAARLAGER